MMKVRTKQRTGRIAVLGMGLILGSTWLVKATPVTPQQQQQRQEQPAAQQPEQATERAPAREPARQPMVGQEQATPEDEVVALRAELQQLQHRTQQIQTRLNAIAREAMQENPELQRQQESLQVLYREKLEELGYPGEEDLEQLQAMQARLQDPEALEPEERERLTREFQQRVTELQQIQMRAREDEVVQERLQALEKAHTEAMHEVDEEMPALEEQLADDQDKIQELQQTIMMRQQRQQPPRHPQQRQQQPPQAPAR